jgi:hypothetical protein
MPSRRCDRADRADVVPRGNNRTISRRGGFGSISVTCRPILMSAKTNLLFQSRACHWTSVKTAGSRTSDYVRLAVASIAGCSVEAASARIVVGRGYDRPVGKGWRSASSGPRGGLPVNGKLPLGTRPVGRGSVSPQPRSVRPGTRKELNPLSVNTACSAQQQHRASTVSFPTKLNQTGKCVPAT